jgi:hypothetical protein
MEHGRRRSAERAKNFSRQADTQDLLIGRSAKAKQEKGHPEIPDALNN